MSPDIRIRLNGNLPRLSQAAKTAIIIAKQEQDLGNYKVDPCFLSCIPRLTTFLTERSVRG